MRNRIILDTGEQIQKFVSIVSKIDADVIVTDGEYRVNGKSFLGLAYGSAEFTDLWVECEKDIYNEIKEFIVD